MYREALPKFRFTVHPDVVNAYFGPMPKPHFGHLPVIAGLKGEIATLHSAVPINPPEGKMVYEQEGSYSMQKPKPAVAVQMCDLNGDAHVILLPANHTPTQVLYVASVDDRDSRTVVDVYSDPGTTEAHRTRRDPWKVEGKKPMPGEKALTLTSSNTVTIRKDGLTTQITPTNATTIVYSRNFSFETKGLTHDIVHSNQLVIDPPKEVLSDKVTAIDKKSSESVQNVYLGFIPEGTELSEVFDGLQSFCQLVEKNSIASLEETRYAYSYNWSEGPSRVTGRVHSGAVTIEYAAYNITDNDGKRYYVIASGDKNPNADTVPFFSQEARRSIEEKKQPAQATLLEKLTDLVIKPKVMWFKNYHGSDEPQARSIDLQFSSEEDKWQELVRSQQEAIAQLKVYADQYQAESDGLREYLRSLQNPDPANFSSFEENINSIWTLFEPILEFFRVYDLGDSLGKLQELRTTLQAIDVPREAAREIRPKQEAQRSVENVAPILKKPVEKPSTGSLQGLTGLFGGKRGR